MVTSRRLSPFVFFLTRPSHAGRPRLAPTSHSTFVANARSGLVITYLIVLKYITLNNRDITGVRE
jgi:hypothetical protein